MKIPTNFNFATGVICGVGLMFLMALAPQYSPYDNPNAVKNEFQTVYNTTQPRNFRLDLSSPTLNSVNENELILLKTDKLKIVTKVNNQLYFVNFSTF